MGERKFLTNKIKRLIYSFFILIIAGTSIGFVLVYEESLNKINGDENLIDGKIFLENKEFSTVFLDGEYIYAGGSGGLFKIHINTYEIKEVLNGDKSFEIVRGIGKTSDNILWIGHGGGLTGIKNDEIIKHYTISNGLPDNRINDIEIKNGIIYVATFGGVGIIENEKIRTITEDNGLIKNITKVVMVDNKGNLWCGSHTSIGGGVTLVNEVDMDYEMIYFNTENGLTHNAITSIKEDKQGNVWIGNGNMTRGGATSYTLKNGEWIPSKILTIKEGLIGDKVRHIFIDYMDNLWFCSESDGIAVFNNIDDIKYLTSESGLSDNEVKEIIYDQDMNLWLASKNGITKIFNEWLRININ
ncbi:two-component regulator propeller domain-containing protein [Clostridiaceae bacterium HSG29]|nr:two-component regulator propeller domain-containing protein [Clostridiaceae bacterium HSG29]